ncbi:MAG: 50S ribosomal protein L5 [Planctomycetota bacterium]
MSRLRERYHAEIVPKMCEHFGISNKLAAPYLRKTVVNRGVGKALENAKRLEAAMKELSVISGQWPAACRARQSISNFRLRENNAIGCKVTLRGTRMFEFVDRLISVVIPRIRDFRGFPSTAFDGRGNYSLGLADQVVFPEIRIDDVEFVQGMDITFDIVNSDDERSLYLLTEFGFPFRRL